MFHASMHDGLATIIHAPGMASMRPDRPAADTESPEALLSAVAERGEKLNNLWTLYAGAGAQLWDVTIGAEAYAVPLVEYDGALPSSIWGAPLDEELTDGLVGVAKGASSSSWTSKSSPLTAPTCMRRTTSRFRKSVQPERRQRLYRGGLIK